MVLLCQGVGKKLSAPDDCRSNLWYGDGDIYQNAADLQPTHCALLPFTRNAFDPMDFTPMNLYKLTHSNSIRKTTASFELALSVLFLSGIQHYAESPEGMSHVPGYVKEFLQQLPNNWDDVKFIDGYPGKYAVIARKSGNKWYVAGINGENCRERIVVGFICIKKSKRKNVCGRERR